MKIFIKNMVSERCKMLVKTELEKLNIEVHDVDLGFADTDTITDEKMLKLNEALELSGLGVIVNKKQQIVEKLKAAVIQMVHYSDDEPKSSLSSYLSNKLGYDYTYLANVFSVAEGTTLEKFMIAHKIERAKELLVYGDLTLTQIATRLHYSSVGHLSNQFKRSTGVSPSAFKKRANKNRINLENV